MSYWRWAEYFCDIPPEHQITLGEGNTPLVRSASIGPALGLDHLYFKMESANPTGSYKDRYAAAAISDMRANGQALAVGTSSGNAGSAIAAYCARAGMRCEIAIVETTPLGKVKQMLAYGAKLYRVRGMGVKPEATQGILDELRRKASRPEAKLQISAFVHSPEGMAGVQTMSYEIAEQGGAIGQTIQHVFTPAGGGGLTLGVALGFAGLAERGELARSPAVHVVQPEGNDTIAGPLRDGADEAHACNVTTLISGLQVASVADGNDVIRICRASGGTGYLVSDEFVWQLQRRLAIEEGIFSEPAGVVALAGAIQAVQNGEIKRDESVVCLVTGIGFKDLPSVDRMVEGIECPTIDIDQIADQ